MLLLGAIEWVGRQVKCVRCLRLPHSLDRPQCDSWVFSRVKNNHKSKRFALIQDIKAAVRAQVKTLM